MESCTRCGLPFDTAHSAAQHLWKSEDEDHEDVETLDDALREVVTNGKPTDEMEEQTDEPTVNHGDPNGTANGTTTAPSEAVTDGGTGLGLSGPPETSDPADDDLDEDDEDDEPETVDCPHCGTDTGEPEDALEPGVTYRCTECAGKFRRTA